MQVSCGQGRQVRSCGCEELQRKPRWRTESARAENTLDTAQKRARKASLRGRQGYGRDRTGVVQMQNANAWTETAWTVQI